MKNARSWRWRGWPPSTGRWPGRRIILCLWLLIFATSCASAPPIPLARVTPPPRPELTEPIRDLQHEGKAYLIIRDVDWRAIGAWALGLEHRLKVACLMLGGTPEQCGTGP
jgi:hypothetical protein